MSTTVSTTTSPSVHVEIEDERSDSFFVVGDSDLGDDGAKQWYESTMLSISQNLDSAIVELDSAACGLPQATQTALTAQLNRSVAQYATFEISAAEGVFSTLDILTLNRDVLVLKESISTAVASTSLAA